jgi:hypothetical protein
LSLTETCLEIILQEKVKIRNHIAPQVRTSNLNIPRLGGNTLGRDSLLGNDFLDFNPQLLIEVGPLSDSDLLLDYLYKLILPLMYSFFFLSRMKFLYWVRKTMRVV